MNYLSHFYFDRHTPDPYYLLGIALPDLSRNYNRKWNLHPHKYRDRWLHDPYIQSVDKGWARHLEVDRLFHNSDFFMEQVQKLKVQMLPAIGANPVLRTSVLAHVTLELMLDALLIRHSKIDPADFYNHLLAIDHEKLMHFLLYNNIAEPEAFLPFFNRFNTVKYLFSYRDNESIIYALNRLCLRIWSTDLTTSEWEELRKGLDLAFDELSKDYLYIFDQISAKL